MSICLIHLDLDQATFYRKMLPPFQTCASNAIYKFSTLQMFYQTTLQFRDMIVSEGYLMRILYHHNLLFQTLINLVKTDFPSYQ